VEKEATSTPYNVYCLDKPKAYNHLGVYESNWYNFPSQEIMSIFFLEVSELYYSLLESKLVSRNKLGVPEEGQ